MCSWTDIANNPLHKWQRKTADEIGEAPGPDTDHGMFIEWRNIIKSLSNTRQQFSCQLDEGIAKVCKKFKSQGGFMSHLQDRTANPANLAAIFCPALVCPQKAIMGIEILAYFCSPLVK